MNSEEGKNNKLRHAFILINGETTTIKHSVFLCGIEQNRCINEIRINVIYDHRSIASHDQLFRKNEYEVKVLKDGYSSLVRMRLIGLTFSNSQIHAYGGADDK